MANGLKTAANLNLATSFMSGITSLAGAYAQGQAARAQADYASTVANINNRFAEIEARDIIKTGDERAAEHGKNIKQLVGKQRAGFAAGNVLVGSGTAGAIEDQTREIGFEEQQNIRNNAWKQAFGVKLQARSQVLEAKNQSRAADFEARNTLITGGLNAIGTIGSGISNFQKFRTSEDNKKKEKDNKVALVYDPGKYRDKA